MKALIGNVRKDGKYPVTYCFDNGRRIKKIVSYDEALKAQNESTDLVYHPTPFDLMSNRN